jgi:hypothetical protein
LRETEEVATLKVIKKKRTLKRKFQIRKNPHINDARLIGATEPRNFPLVVNRSTQEFSFEQLELLNKGLKFRPAPEKIPLDEIVVQLETSVERCRDATKQWVREEVKPQNFCVQYFRVQNFCVQNFG